MGRHLHLPDPKGMVPQGRRRHCGAAELILWTATAPMPRRPPSPEASARGLALSRMKHRIGHVQRAWLSLIDKPRSHKPYHLLLCGMTRGRPLCRPRARASGLGSEERDGGAWERRPPSDVEAREWTQLRRLLVRHPPSWGAADGVGCAVKLGRARRYRAAIVAATALCLVPVPSGSARTEPRDNTPAGGIDLGARGASPRLARRPYRST